MAVYTHGPCSNMLRINVGYQGACLTIPRVLILTEIVALMLYMIIYEHDALLHRRRKQTAGCERCHREALTSIISAFGGRRLLQNTNYRLCVAFMLHV